ncbi:dihydroxyacetone kinase subunit DhaL [Nonomuraea roseoviolacea]|uniref:Dihydroxyacetone kinase-like protein n=1 Tax=Nonomuraea roseoviolacea subsp. carminata TaxID=160689 RepID=A0ABT1JQU5_9ACTN|nr:dihydroxyacetone kinase subunit DhaL [Nonomuraea roseoviolacea]MCP2344101.1 dihydroxyacetone kinase-like protein [Nonomuraea roseoviolacea subsp. carminata]
MGAGTGAGTGAGGGGGLDAAFFVAWLEEAAGEIARQRDRLTELDAAIGDADHGTNLDRGFSEVLRTLRETPPASPAQALMAAGATLIRRVGGASGPLYGSAFRQMGKTLDGGEAPRPSVTPAELAEAFSAGVVAVERLGKAAAGDKTMIDALAPASRALSHAVRDGLEVREALTRAARAAADGARATVPMTARRGRASYLGERSVGHEDPGAASSALIVTALATAASRTAAG